MFRWIGREFRWGIEVPSQDPYEGFKLTAIFAVQPPYSYRERLRAGKEPAIARFVHGIDEFAGKEKTSASKS